MSAIFGCVDVGPAGSHRDSPAQALAPMDAAMTHWGSDGHGKWDDGQCALGQRLSFNTPEAVHENLPRLALQARVAITAAARIDNRDALCDIFGIPAGERPATPDSELILRAYLRWDEACPDHLLGDWSFAIWNPGRQTLFLARDHCGNTSLCYWQQPGQFSFASSPAALIAAGASPHVNELFLAQLLVSWPNEYGPQTINLDIQRLPPAHAMTVTPGGMRVWRYWQLENTPELRLRSFDDYLEGFLDVYGEAVNCRLRSLRPVGTTLSGGLDSGSITALAARELARQGRRLTAFTAVPRFDTTQAVGARRFGDETHFAASTARQCGNVDQILLDSAHISPLAGIRRFLAISPEPRHAASNFFWIVDLLERAQAQGLGTLLTGQGGNATVSWTGAPELRSPLAAFRHGGWKQGLRYSLPVTLLRLRLRYQTANWSHTAIHPDFARRMKLHERRIDAFGEPSTPGEHLRSPREMRYAIIQPGGRRVGELWAELGAATGMEVRDPTFDKRVMAFTIAVPDPMFRSATGMDRQLMRAAMAGLIPDEVRLNRLRGRQSADLAGRLLASRDEVDAALAFVSKAPAGDYIEAAKLQHAWDDVRRETTALTTHRAGSILLRGLMAGLYLNHA